MISLYKNRLIIKYYQELLSLDNHLLEFKIDNQYLVISGNNIEIHYYSEDEIIIKGKIENIKII